MPQNVESLAKLLAHNEKAQRDSGMAAVPQFLREVKKPIANIDLMKLWRGLFYCFWMSDKVPVQQALADVLSKLIHEFTDATEGLRFLKAFMDTMKKEWVGIDHLRMDKYLSLVRKAMRQYILYFKARRIDEDSLDGVMDVFSVLKTVPNGLRYHIVELFYDELLAAYSEITTEALQLLLMPFYQVLVACDDVKLFHKTLACLIKPVLAAAAVTDEQPKALLRNVDLRDLSSDMFLIASSPDTQSSHRKPLYQLKEKYEPICLAMYGDEESNSGSDAEGAEAANSDEEEEEEEEEDSSEGSSEDGSGNDEPVDAGDWMILKEDDDSEDDDSEDDEDDDDDISDVDDDELDGLGEDDIVTFKLPRGSMGSAAAKSPASSSKGKPSPSPVASAKKGKATPSPQPQKQSPKQQSPATSTKALQSASKASPKAGEPSAAAITPSKTPAAAAPASDSHQKKRKVDSTPVTPSSAAPTPASAEHTSSSSKKKRRNSVDQPEAAAAGAGAGMTTPTKPKASPKAQTTGKKRVSIVLESSTAIEYPLSVQRLRQSKPRTREAVPVKGLLKTPSKK